MNIKGIHTSGVAQATMDGWTDVLVPPANSTLLPRANLAASENEKNTTEESGEDWRQRRGHRPAAGSRRHGGPAAVASCKGEREGGER